MSTAELLKLGAFGRQIKVAFESTRDISLINQIDQTVETIADLTVKFQSMALMTEHFIDVLQKSPVFDVADLDDFEQIFSTSRDIAADYYSEQVVKRQCAIDDSRLTAEDGVVDAYDALLHEVVDFHNNLNQLAWLIGEHIAESDETLPGTYTSADELFEAIGV